jgi:hypothetical protein
MPVRRRRTAAPQQLHAPCHRRRNVRFDPEWDPRASLVVPSLPHKQVNQIDSRLAGDQRLSIGLDKGVAVFKPPCAKERKQSPAFTDGVQNHRNGNSGLDLQRMLDNYSSRLVFI